MNHIYRIILNRRVFRWQQEHFDGFRSFVYALPFSIKKIQGRAQ